MAFVRAKKMILPSSNRIPQINWEINNHNNNNISPRLCASVCVCEREKVWGRMCKAKLGKKWCRRRTTGQVSVGAWLLPLVLSPLAMLIWNDICSLPLFFFCPFHVHTILWSLWLASDAEGHYPQDKKKISRTDTRRASFSFISLYICALWSDHTLNIYLDVVVDWLVPRTLPAPTQSTRFDGSSPTGTCQRKKKNHEWFFFSFFFCVCVMTVHVFICTATAALSVTAPCFHPAPHFLQEKRISGEKNFISFRWVIFFYVRFLFVLPFYNRSLRLSWLRRCCCVY